MYWTHKLSFNFYCCFIHKTMLSEPWNHSYFIYYNLRKTVSYIQIVQGIVAQRRNGVLTLLVRWLTYVNNTPYVPYTMWNIVQISSITFHLSVKKPSSHIFQNTYSSQFSNSELLNIKLRKVFIASIFS